MEAMKAGLHNLHDLIKIWEYVIPHIILANVVPDMLGRIELRTIGGQRDQRHVRWNDQVAGFMPSCLIENHHTVILRKSGRCL